MRTHLKNFHNLVMMRTPERPQGTMKQPHREIASLRPERASLRFRGFARTDGFLRWVLVKERMGELCSSSVTMLVFLGPPVSVLCAARARVVPPDGRLGADGAAGDACRGADRDWRRRERRRDTGRCPLANFLTDRAGGRGRGWVAHDELLRVRNW